jgi:hypothetical protein
MSENRAILEKTFALTSQQQEGTIVLLDVTVEVRKIPATVERQQPNEPIIIATTRRFAQGQILVEGNLTELEEAPNVVGSSSQTEEEIPIAYVRQEIVDLRESNDEEDEDDEVDSDVTEENPHLAAEEHPSEDSQDRAWPDSPPPSPPPYSPEATSSRRRRSPLDQRGELRSPSPPGYVPSYYLQNMYSPPILLRSEVEYRCHRRDLIRQYNRDSLDLYYKYEFQAQQLKRARRKFY